MWLGIRDDRGRSVNTRRGPAEPRTRAVCVVGISVLAAMLAAMWALYLGGGLRRESVPGLPASEAVVGWGLPAARLVGELAFVLVLGGLLGALILSPRDPAGRLSPVAWRHIKVARWCALGWALASTVQLALLAADLTGLRLGELSWQWVWDAARYSPQGRAVLAAIGAALVVSTCAWLARRSSLVVVAFTAAVAGVLPTAFVGHASTSADHNSATISLAGHIIAVSIWVGGLAAVVCHAFWHPAGLPAAARRFSVIAAVCFAVVAATGVLNAALRLESPSDLVRSGYGAIIVAKVLALLCLGGIGWWHRAHILRAVDSHGSGRLAFVRLASVELVVMAMAMGLAVGLSRSRPPAELLTAQPGPITALLGYPMPAPPTLARMALGFRLDLLFAVGCLVAAAGYLTAVWRLQQRAVPWPVHRTVCWLGGVAVVFVATNGGPAKYAPVLFSVHMVTHMLTAMLGPILLAVGAPITLALRALPAAPDRTLPGPREWLTSALHSRLTKVLVHPAVAGGLWVGGLYAMYFTGLYEAALRSHPIHIAVVLHFIGSGYIFFAILISPDPLPRRLAYPARMVVLLAALAFHAFFGVALMQTTEPIAGQWFTDIARPWGPSALSDQRVGGGIAWAISEAPALVVLLVLFRQWIKADEREQRRLDRAVDRDGDAALAAYNRWLQENART